jgi:two-component system, NarL family, sensor histidine kinase UhpB
MSIGIVEGVVMQEKAGRKRREMTSCSEHPIRILLVEDSEDDALLLSSQLKRDGYKIISKRVDTIAELQAALDKADWDIVISGYMLPEFTGLDTLGLIQERSLDIPCIIVSGKTYDETAVNAMKAGATDYVLKDNLVRLGPAVRRAQDKANERSKLNKAQEKLRQYYQELEQRVNERPAELKDANERLEKEIEERKKTESALKQRQKLLQDMIDGATESIIFVKDLEGRFIISNRHQAELLGRTKQAIEGKTDYDIFPREWADYYSEHDMRIIASGKAEQLEEEGGDWLGMSLWNKHYFLSNKFPLFDADGKLYAMGVVSFDITERKRAEEALANYKDELEIKVKERTERLQEAYDEITQSQKALKEANKLLKQYSNKITQVQEEEKKRIAYELHDDTAQYLSILKMQIGALAESGDIQNPKVKEKLLYLEKDADRAFNDVRRYSHELRPTALEHQGLVAALEQIADDFNKLGQLSVEVQIEGMEPELSEEIKLGFFRIAQEALNNTRKHSKAKEVIIELKFNLRSMRMVVIDDGIGFDVKEANSRSGGRGSLGLMSMRERADLINASLKIESEPEKGTMITVKAKLNIENKSPKRKLGFQDNSFISEHDI